MNAEIVIDDIRTIRFIDNKTRYCLEDIASFTKELLFYTKKIHDLCRSEDACYQFKNVIWIRNFASHSPDNMFKMEYGPPAGMEYESEVREALSTIKLINPDRITSTSNMSMLASGLTESWSMPPAMMRELTAYLRHCLRPDSESHGALSEMWHYNYETNIWQNIVDIWIKNDLRLGIDKSVWDQERAESVRPAVIRHIHTRAYEIVTRAVMGSLRQANDRHAHDREVIKSMMSAFSGEGTPWEGGPQTLMKMKYLELLEDSTQF